MAGVAAVIFYGVKWPSIQADSEILRQRIAPALRVLVLRRILRSYLDATELAA